MCTEVSAGRVWLFFEDVSKYAAVPVWLPVSPPNQSPRILNKYPKKMYKIQRISSLIKKKHIFFCEPKHP